jgi:hypothetical protein
VADWQALARRAARREGVDPNIFVRLVGAESTGNPNAVSPAGAIGYTQLMPDTARGLGVNPRDPWQNLVGGARYLKQQLHTFGNYGDALRAYNAGPGAVRQSHGYAETNAYVQKILRGANPAAGTRAPRAGSAGPAPTASSAPSGLGGLTSDPGSSGDVSALLSLLTQKRQAPASMGVQAPAFSARPAMPAGYQAPVSGGGPEPRQDINQLLELVRTQGGAGPTGGGSATGGQDIPAGQMTAPTGGTRQGSGTGHVTIAPSANRAGAKLNPAVVGFVDRVSGLYGRPLTIGTGTNHSRLTINGTVSDHWSGNGADIPLAGRPLIRAGQNALIAAGMPASRARKITGGGFNVGGWQVIFNTDAPGWGDHTDHLHVGRRVR